MGGEAPNNVGAGGSILGALTMPLLLLYLCIFDYQTPEEKGSSSIRNWLIQ